MNDNQLKNQLELDELTKRINIKLHDLDWYEDQIGLLQKQQDETEKELQELEAQRFELDEEMARQEAGQNNE